jgi:hypothetical protein
MSRGPVILESLNGVPRPSHPSRDSQLSPGTLMNALVFTSHLLDRTQRIRRVVKNLYNITIRSEQIFVFPCWFSDPFKSVSYFTPPFTDRPALNPLAIIDMLRSCHCNFIFNGLIRFVYASWDGKKIIGLDIQTLDTTFQYLIKDSNISQK